MKELLKDDVVLEAFERNDITESTKTTYALALQEYTELIGKSPRELLDEARLDNRSGLPVEERKLSSYLTRYRSTLQNPDRKPRSLAPYTVRNRLTGVVSFYLAFGIETPKLRTRGKKARAKGLPENRVIPKKDDIQTALDKCDVLERAIVLTGVSSGLSVSDIIQLKYKAFEEGYDEKRNIVMLKLTRFKTCVEFTTFLSPEATNAILDYLKYRERDPATDCKRRTAQLSKQKIDEDGYLFVKRNVRDSYLKTHNEEERKLTQNAVQKIYRAISQKAGLSTARGHWNTIRSHNMRKFFNTNLTMANCNATLTETMMGHSIGDVKEAYLIPDDDKFKDIYAQYAPYVTVQKQLDISTSPEYQEAITRAEKAETEATRVSVERNEIQRLKAEIEEIKNANKRITAATGEFEPILEEEKAQSENITSILNELGVDFEEALDKYNIGAMRLPDSDRMRAHRQRCHEDPAYHTRWIEIYSGKLERQKKNAERTLLDVLGE